MYSSQYLWVPDLEVANKLSPCLLCMRDFRHWNATLALLQTRCRYPNFVNRYA
jgi:hypothetical protein